MSDLNAPHHIKSIYVANLFGRYSYQLPAPTENLSELNIIYGENGAGKTTLLNLVFHLLSPSDNRGHRAKIAETPFSLLRVELNDGTLISAIKDAQLLVGPVLFSIKTPNVPSVDWHFTPGQSSGSFRIEDLPSTIDVKKLPTGVRNEVERMLTKRQFFEAIGKLRIVTYMLTSDRILLGDSLEPNENDQRIQMRNRSKLAEIVADHRIASVAEAMNTASSWLQTKFLEKSYSVESAKSPYEEVVRRIAKTTYRTKTGLNKTQEERVILNLKNMIFNIDRRSKEVSQYGLGVMNLSSDIASVIELTKGNRLNLISSVLEPYLNGLNAKLDGIYPLYDLINILVLTVNKFFNDKKLHYSVRSGLKIFIDPPTNNQQEILPSQLSSGEQQLVLLFCYVLVARDTPSVFIIDEPEISLNILWQRMLVSSLQALAKGSELQFIFASHSMEILSKHRNRVISMQETKK